MATVTSSAVASTVQARAAHAGLNYAYATYAVPASGDGTAANDVIQMVKVPAGARVLDVILTSEDLDTNASPTTVFDVGDGDDPDRYIDGTTIGQGGGVVRIGQSVAAGATDGLFYRYTTEDTIDITVAAAGSTKAAGNVTLCVLYSTD